MPKEATPEPKASGSTLKQALHELLGMDLVVSIKTYNALGRGAAVATSRERCEQLAPTG
jgi:hypothetical protein